MKRSSGLAGVGEYGVGQPSVGQPGIAWHTSSIPGTQYSGTQYLIPGRLVRLPVLHGRLTDFLDAHTRSRNRDAASCDKDSQRTGWPRAVSRPGLPQTRTCAINAFGSSSYHFATPRQRE